MRAQSQSQSHSRHPQTVKQLICVIASFSFLLFFVQSSIFRGGRDRHVSIKAEVEILSQFQSNVQQCVAKRGLGLTAQIIDHCKLKLIYPEGTNSTWYNVQFKKKEPLEYDYDICEAILLWEQYRNVTTVLTREYLDVRPDGWLDYAAKRIAQLYGFDLVENVYLGDKKCYNQSLCDELLSPILPATPPFHPRQFERCAVVGNSGDLLLTEFGEEIDSHDAVIRDNEAPVNEKYAKHVGMKRTFRLGVRGTARNMIDILKGARKF
ncbi:Sialyltransferase-like protein 1 [Bienertia sinuspersici]